MKIEGKIRDIRFYNWIGSRKEIDALKRRIEELRRKERNEAIARALGFKSDFYEGATRWIYPKEYEHLRASSLERLLPDFIGMIEIFTDRGIKFVEVKK